MRTVAWVVWRELRDGLPPRTEQVVPDPHRSGEVRAEPASVAREPYRVSKQLKQPAHVGQAVRVRAVVLTRACVRPDIFPVPHIRSSVWIDEGVEIEANLVLQREREVPEIKCRVEKLRQQKEGDDRAPVLSRTPPTAAALCPLRERSAAGRLGPQRCPSSQQRAAPQTSRRLCRSSGGRQRRQWMSRPIPPTHSTASVCVRGTCGGQFTRCDETLQFFLLQVLSSEPCLGKISRQPFFSLLPHHHVIVCITLQA